MNKRTWFGGRGLGLIWLLIVCLGGSRAAAEVIPAEPTRYFNDYALVVKPETAQALNQKLVELEQQSSDQVLVCIYPAMQSDSDVADYCLRVFRSWKIGQKDKNNGAVLFVFIKGHHLWIQTGRGLEGALPDATCKDITADLIAPKFKAGDYDGGLTAGVDAMIAATKGEYKGSGTTVYQREHANDGRAANNGGGFGLGTIFFLIALFFIFSSFFRRRGPGGRSGGTMFGGGPPIFFPGGGFGGGGGGGFGGGGDSGGGFGGGDSGGFSSGGGDTGGGGAGSDW